MKFKDALKAAGLRNPGRTTRHGQAEDGTSVFTIWSDDIHLIDGRSFAWWDHCGEPALHEEPSAREKDLARTFVDRAASSIGKRCRVVIVNPARPKPESRAVASAEYPHPRWAEGEFRSADRNAMHFVVELFPMSRRPQR